MRTKTRTGRPIAAAVAAALAAAPVLASASPRPAPEVQTQVLQTDGAFELLPPPPRGALEYGLSGPRAARYAQAVRALRAGDQREALSALREARALAYRELEEGPTDRVLAYRHFVRLVFLEEQVSELIDLERHMEREKERLSPDERALYLQGRALLLHNEFLAVRAATGQRDERVLGRALQAYEAALGRQGALRSMAQIGYASLLAERGDRRGASAQLARVPLEEQQAERSDLAMAYYHLAQGSPELAMARLLQAARRENWIHPSGQDGRSLRSMVYRMNDFDKLREHPRFIELVTRPEEEAVTR
jgi:hypothetical protein